MKQRENKRHFALYRCDNCGSVWRSWFQWSYCPQCGRKHKI